MVGGSKTNRLEVYEIASGGLEAKLQIPINGRIVSLSVLSSPPVMMTGHTLDSVWLIERSAFAEVESIASGLSTGLYGKGELLHPAV